MKEKKNHFLNSSLIHDIEIFPNFFSDIFKIPGESKLFITILFEGKEWHDLPEEIINFIREELGEYDIEFRTTKQITKRLRSIQPFLIGYNNYYYDDIILKFMMKRMSNDNDTLYKLSNSLIKGKKNRLKYDKSIISIDLMRISGADRIYKPLKQTAANLKHYLIQDLPLPFSESIKLDKIPEIIIYELNDVLIAEKMLLGIPESQKSPTIPLTAYKGLLPGIDFRMDIGKMWNIDILNNNKSQIGEKIAAKLYSDVSSRDYYDFRDGLTWRDSVKYSDVIFDNIKFKTPQLKEFLTCLKKLEYQPEVNKSSEFTFEFEFYDSIITFAQGGIHGIHKDKKVFRETKTTEIVDLDVGSYYPNLYWKYNVEPKHLPHFNDFVGEIINLRMNYKKAGIKLYANGLKLGINRIFGGFSDPHGWLYDILAFLKVTINGQLMILMLAEALELAGIPVFYYNTDGITVECDSNKRDVLNKIWKEWEKKTLMSLEAASFSKCHIRDVNNFLNIKTNGEVKYKGAYTYDSYIEENGEFSITKSFNHPIVPYAASQYLTKQIPIEKTIYEHRDIYDFCIAKKTGKQFKNHLFTINGVNVKEEIIQQSVRFYVSNSKQKLFKVKQKTEAQLINLVNKKGKAKKHAYFLSKDEHPFNIIYTFEDETKIYIIPNASIFPEPLKEWISYTDVCAGKNITLFNKYFKTNNWEDYNIDYDFYIKEANKLLLSLENNKG